MSITPAEANPPPHRHSICQVTFPVSNLLFINEVKLWVIFIPNQSNIYLRTQNRKQTMTDTELFHNPGTG